MTNNLDYLRQQVRATGRAVITDAGRYHWTADDDAMLAAAAGDALFEWVDDIESRLGGRVADFREAMLDYVIARDGQV